MNTGYDVRIGDWSSDVCSSDLMFQNIVRPFVEARQFVQPCLDDALDADGQVDRFRAQFMKSLAKSLAVYRNNVTVLGMFSEAEAEVLLYLSQGHSRSEEHTSELQSLMRISYAVFCLKKKKHKK